MLVIPVKDARRGKSRLNVPGVDRVALARAIATDTIVAALGCQRVHRVIVVTGDPVISSDAEAIGATAVDDRAAPDLNAAIALGVAAAVGPAFRAPRLLERPESLDPEDALGHADLHGTPYSHERPALFGHAALLGDLPALRPRDLATALDACAQASGTEGSSRAVIADAEGIGSTLVTADVGSPWQSAFGANSLARHRALGCVLAPVPERSTVRRDVDTAAQLKAALAFGLGARTARVLNQHSILT